jgi:hypothetical protein
MAGAAQHRSCGNITKAPSASSDDGTLSDTPLNDGTTTNDVGSAEQSQVPHAGKSAFVTDCLIKLTHDLSAQDEIALLGANVIEALSVVSKLEKLGLDKQEISLPKCIVLGACRVNSELHSY